MHTHTHTHTLQHTHSPTHIHTHTHSQTPPSTPHPTPHTHTSMWTGQSLTSSSKPTTSYSADTVSQYLVQMCPEEICAGLWQRTAGQNYHGRAREERSLCCTCSLSKRSAWWCQSRRLRSQTLPPKLEMGCYCGGKLLCAFGEREREKELRQK